MEAKGAQREDERYKGETPQQCVQYASFPTAKSKRGANPPSSEATGVQPKLVTNQYRSTTGKLLSVGQ
eukprot:7047509-Heterocapsa_arctica.AAC.1